MSQQLPTDHVESTTTEEQDLHSASQRGINRTWEDTQARISLMVVGTTCVGVIVNVALRAFLPALASVAFPAEWWTIVGLVIGFYFGRTNHARVGGVQLGR